MSESNRVSIRIIEESPYTWGVLPDTPAMRTIRFVDQDFVHNIECKVSNEIRPDRTASDTIQLTKRSMGGFKFELSPTTFDSLIAAALSNTWRQIEALPWSSGLKLIGWTCTPIVPNDHYYMITTAGNAGAQEPAVWPTTYRATVDDGTAQWTCMGPVSAIESGIIKKSFSIEKAMLDVEQYFLYTGMMINKMEITIRANEPIVGSFEFIGKMPDNPLNDATVAFTVLPPTTTRTMNSINNVGMIYEFGTPLDGVYLQELSFSVNNNLRGKTAIANNSIVGVAHGACDITGNIVAYFTGNRLYNRFVGNAYTSIVVPISNTDGGYLLIFPRIKLETNKGAGGTLNTEIMERIKFRCLYDPQSQSQIGIRRTVTPEEDPVINAIHDEEIHEIVDEIDDEVREEH